jgi:hypothetical protein
MYRYSSLYRILPLLLLLATPKAFAATAPSLGAASTYVVLGSTFTNTTAGTMITGDIGFTTGPAVAPGGNHTNYGPGAPYALAGSNQGTALSALAGEPCTFTFPPGAINLSTDTTHGPVGTYTPGVYCSAGAMNIGGPLTLSGNGIFLFRPNGALTSTAGAVVSLSGAAACNVFWTPTQATTLAANTTMVGTVIADAGITVGANVTWTGRALAFGGTVTTDTVTIVPCQAAIPASSSLSSSAVSSSAISNIASLSSLASSTLSSSFSSRSSSSVQPLIQRSSIASVSERSSRIRSSRRSYSSSSASIAPVNISTIDPIPPPIEQREIVMPVTGVDLGPVSSVLGLLMAFLFAHLSLFRR